MTEHLRYSVGIIVYVSCLLVSPLSFSLWLILNLLTLITYQEEDREKLLETKLQQIEVLCISG